MESLAFTSLRELSKKLSDKSITPRQLLSLTEERFKKYDGPLNSALQVFDTESVLKDLPAEPTSPLWGVPGLIKDVICQKDRITSCASRILENYKAPYDATAITRLKDAGALCMGRANCDEFAMGSSGETSAYGPTKNPWDTSRVPGGSSSGPAAAVAAGLVSWSLGSETGGSVRQPAALCGIVGLKPTYGRISRYGLIAYSSSIDQIGTFTRTVYDNALVLNALAGHDTHDSTSRTEVAEDYTKNLTGSLKPGLKIGIIQNALEANGMDSEVKASLYAAIEHYKSLGATVEMIQLPTMEYSAAVYFIVSRAEAASNLSRMDGVKYGFRASGCDTLTDLYERTRSQGFGHMVKKRIMIGNYVLSSGHADAYYKSAKKVQSRIRAEFLKAFSSFDVLFAPVSPTTAFKFNEISGIAMDLQDYFTAPANLAGIPSLGIPCGFSKAGLPIGFQLFGPDLSESLLYQTAYAYEQSTPWHTMHPKAYE